jgi:lipoate-protein ligase A
METHRSAIEACAGQQVNVEGVSDLAVNGRKFSGNAQKRGSRALLFHGSFLLDADLDLIKNCLRHPTSEPGWRNNRSHTDFITNLRRPTADIVQALSRAWSATPAPPPDLHSQIDLLCGEKYHQKKWRLIR